MRTIQFISRRRVWYSISAVVVAVCLIAIGVFGLQRGLDFVGGSLLEVSYSHLRPESNEIVSAISHLVPGEVRIQPSAERGAIIRMPDIDEETHQRIRSALSESASAISEGNTMTENRFESFGPSLGSELQRSAVYALVFVLCAIIIYIAYAFRKVSKPVASWKFGATAVIALAHDTIIVVGIFSILGYLYQTEINSFFVTALLTLLGFSVHDTIVTLDRVRENIEKHADKPFDETVNDSINQTLTRSINTSVTTLFTLVAIYLVGGESIRDLSLALILGIIVGTYSSVFIAAPLLVTFYRFAVAKKDD